MRIQPFASDRAKARNLPRSASTFDAEYLASPLASFPNLSHSSARWSFQSFSDTVISLSDVSRIAAHDEVNTIR